MSLRLAALLVAVVGLTPAMAETPADRWNLAELYPSDAAWNADASKLEAQMKDLAACKGHLGGNAARFKKCLDLQADMGKRYARMNLYASEQLAGDTGAAAFLELSQKAEVLGARLNEATSFMNPEILRLGKNKIARFVAQDASLKIYRHPLDEILRLAPHTLDSEGESLVAQFGLMSGAGGSAYSILTNADIPWPTIKLSTGEEVRLDASAYTKYREAPNRDDRKRVMDAFFGTFKTYERTLGVTLYSQLKEAAVFAKVRKYPDSITSALDANRVPVAVFDMLINRLTPTCRRCIAISAYAPEYWACRRCATTTSIRRWCTATSSSRWRPPSSWCSTQWRLWERNTSRRSTPDSTAGGWTPIHARTSSRAHTWPGPPTMCIRTC